MTMTKIIKIIKIKDDIIDVSILISSTFQFQELICREGPSSGISAVKRLRVRMCKTKRKKRVDFLE